MPSLVDYVGLIVTPTGTPAMGDIVVRGQSGGWTTVQVGTAAQGAVLTIGPTGMPIWGTPVASSLATPSAGNEGAIQVVSASGLRDLPYVCVAVPGGTYEWDRIPLTLQYTLGDGVNHLFSLAHYLGHQTPLVSVVNAATNEQEYPDITFPDVQHANIEFGTGNIPGVNGYKVRVNG